MEALEEEEEEEEGERAQTWRQDLDSNRDETRKDQPLEERRTEWAPKEKLGPPIPSLKAGDETAKGALEPLVDEIACALREWHSVSWLLSPCFPLIG